MTIIITLIGHPATFLGAYADAQAGITIDEQPAFTFFCLEEVESALAAPDASAPAANSPHRIIAVGARARVRSQRNAWPSARRPPTSPRAA